MNNDFDETLEIADDIVESLEVAAESEKSVENDNLTSPATDEDVKDVPASTVEEAGINFGLSGDVPIYGTYYQR